MQPDENAWHDWVFPGEENPSGARGPTWRSASQSSDGESIPAVSSDSDGATVAAYDDPANGRVMEWCSRGASVRSEESDDPLAGACSTRVMSQDAIKGLSVDIDAELLRGVRMQRVLSGFGEIFSGHCAGSIALDRYHVYSENVQGLHDFISHDWLTPRLLKVVSLCYVYNAKPACAASMLAGIVGCFLQQRGVLTALGSQRSIVIEGDVVGVADFGGWCVLVFCPSVFWAVFFFWQRLRTIFLITPVMVFVDKICINQTDVDLKVRALRALAGFLNNSERLVILWSPRYFTRLWCTYEVATWIHLRKSVDRGVLFLPVVLPPVCLMTAILLHAVLAVLALLEHRLEFVGIGVLCLASGFGFVAHMLRHLLSDLGHLARQLENFSIRDSKCYCCTNGHVDPCSGEDILCDRKYVYATVTAWFGTGMDIEDEAAALDEFDARVRSDFEKCMNITAGRLSRRLVDYGNALVVSMPVLWYGMDRCFGVGQLPSYELYFRTVLQWVVISFTAVPIVFATTLDLAALLERQGLGRKRSREHDTLPFSTNVFRTIVTPVASFFSLAALVGLCQFQRAPMEHLSWPCQAAAALLQMAFTVFLYRRSAEALIEACRRSKGITEAESTPPRELELEEGQAADLRAEHERRQASPYRSSASATSTAGDVDTDGVIELTDSFDIVSAATWSPHAFTREAAASFVGTNSAVTTALSDAASVATTAPCASAQGLEPGPAVNTDSRGRNMIIVSL